MIDAWIRLVFLISGLLATAEATQEAASAGRMILAGVLLACLIGLTALVISLGLAIN